MDKSVWLRVVDCALSNSLHFPKTIEVSEISEVEQERILSYISGKVSNPSLANEIYSERAAEAARKKRRDGAYPLWLQLGLLIGILSLCTSIVNLILTGFLFIFFIYLVVSFMIIIPCIADYLKLRNMRKASKIWNMRRRELSQESLDLALGEMEALLSRE